MTRIICTLIAGLLLCFWGLVAHASEESQALIARCTTESLKANRISHTAARHLAIGRTVTINHTRHTLHAGDTIWSLCRASLQSTDEREERIKALETKLSEAYGQAENAQKKATAALADLTAANTRVSNAHAEQERLLETAHRLWIAMTALIVLALVLGATLAYTMLLAARERQRLRDRAENPSVALYEEIKRNVTLRELLSSIWPFATLGVIPYTLAPDAVESPSTDEARTFTIALTRLVRSEGAIEAYCVLPWGHEMLYEPARIIRALRSDAAQAYYLQVRGLVLKKSIVGRTILSQPLPDLARIIDESPSFVPKYARA